MEAVASILVSEGVSSVTHQRVAEYSRVSRATLYRHWPSPADLLYEAMAAVQEPIFRENHGALVPWLRAELRRTVNDIRHPVAIQFIAFLLERAAHHPEGAALRTSLLQRTAIPLRRAVEQAVVTGELTAAPIPDDLLACLLGPILFRVVHADGCADESFVDQVIDLALAPWLP
ncbi:MAG TPA: TetR/AcrR family transcriptional regulator C-terminal ligand-binding domain-containing protein [Acidimicrobiales bacterium]|nr:TetR/AcrR family transcriptional regulator C-terminal ligand-binding domain-containing protein [Acidimicrobiales bacterium]